MALSDLGSTIKGRTVTRSGIFLFGLSVMIHAFIGIENHMACPHMGMETDSSFQESFFFT